MKQHVFSHTYVPPSLTKKDKKKQKKMLFQSRKQYKNKTYKVRERLASFRNKKSNHIEHAKRIYHIDKIVPNQELSKKTGCSLSALKKIVEKGEGAYFSSGSRPNQTPQSWGLARLASAITSGKASKIDFDIIEKGCDHHKKAYLLAKKK